MIKIRCLLYHFIIAYGDTLTYNDIPCVVLSGKITFISYVGGQLWNKMKVKLDYHTAVNHFEQYSNHVYASLIVILCFPVLDGRSVYLVCSVNSVTQYSKILP